MIPLKLLGLGVEGLKKAFPRENLTHRQAWVSTNVRPYRGKIESAPGISEYVSGTLSGRPHLVKSWLNDDTVWRLNAVTNTKAYSIDTTTGAITEITRGAGDYTAPVTGFIDGSVMNNLFIFTNGTDNIQKWDGVAANCSDLGGAPPICNTLCAALTFLLLGGIASGLRTIQWSDSEDPEAWSGGDSGSLALYQGPGDVIRLLPLGDVVIGYRRDNIHLLYYVGPPFIWAQRQVVTSHGLLAAKAIVDFGDRHLYWGTDNVYFYDGSQRVAVANDVIDDMMLSFDPTYQDQIHTGVDYQDHKAYFFYPAPGDDGVCYQAWVFDWLTGAWHKESFGAVGVTGSGNYRTLGTLTWAGATGTWADQLISWAQAYYFLENFPIHIVCGADGTINYFDKTVDTILLAGREKIWESGLIDPAEVVFESPDSRCDLLRVTMDFEKNATTTLEVWVGTLDTLLGDADVSWTSYTIPLNGTQGKIDVRKNARYFTLRLRNTSAGQPFRVSGVTPWFALRGRR